MRYITQKLEIGDRVIVYGHWEFPDGVAGSIAEPSAFQLALANPGEWHDHRRTIESRKGPIVFYYVVFDQATDDGSGDGPYAAAEIEAECLFLLQPDT